MAKTREPAPTTPDPIEIAMEAEASGAAPEGIAHEVLRRQSQLLAWQVAGERAGFALKVLTVLAAGLVAATLGAMAWQASQADGLVVEPFLSTPALQAQGLSGLALARQAQDELSGLDAQTGFYRSTAVSDSWSRTSDLPIAQTGVSVGDVQRALRDWLGHETRVSGEVYFEGGQAFAALRASNGQAVTVAGPPDEIRALISRAAEQLFAQARPLQYGYYLARRGDYAGGRRYFEAVIASVATGNEAAQAYTGRATTLHQEGRLAEADADLAAAVRLGSPGFRPYLTRGYIQESLGHSEAALGYFRLAARQPSRPGMAPRTAGQSHAITQSTLETYTGDYLSALASGAPVFETRVPGFFSPDLRTEKLRVLLGLHDLTAARAVAPRVFEASNDPGRRARFQAAARRQIAVAEGDWAGVLAGLDPDVDGAMGLQTATLRIRALTGLGRLDEARAVAAQMPADCEPCLRARGALAEASGERQGADRLYAEAVRQAPSLPFADAEWAGVKLARGDAPGAKANLASAHRKAESFADPLELWGEAMLAQGDAKGAAQKFEQAAKLAPRWGRLHLKWGEALAKLGKANEAQAKWRAAATMDLSAADRAAVKAHGV